MRYFSQPRSSPVRADADDWYDRPLVLEGLSVDDHVAVDTGLIDARGDAIMRAPNPIGFGRDDEW